MRKMYHELPERRAHATAARELAVHVVEGVVGDDHGGADHEVVGGVLVSEGEPARDLAEREHRPAAARAEAVLTSNLSEKIFNTQATTACS